MGEYGPAGNLVAFYHYGYGLLNRTDSANNSAWYTYDAIGNICGALTDSGATANRYAYAPFGSLIMSATTVPNPFLAVGEHGVRAVSCGVLDMRARCYLPSLGTFVSEDPLRLGGVMMRGYAFNNPNAYIDPLGLVSWAKLGQGAVQVGGGLLGIGFGAVAGATPLGWVLIGTGAYSLGAGMRNIWESFSESGANVPGGVGEAFGEWAKIDLGWKNGGKVGQFVDIGVDVVTGKALTRARIPSQLGEVVDDTLSAFDYALTTGDALIDLIEETSQIPIPRSYDPNQKIGPVGVGNGRYVAGGVCCRTGSTLRTRRMRPRRHRWSW